MAIKKLDGSDSTWDIAAKILQSLPFLVGSNGPVAGPGSSVNNDIVVFNGTGGNLLADSGINISSINTTTQVTNETPAGAVNGINTTFTLANTPKLGTEQIFQNGVLQDPGAGNDYTIAGAVITMLSAPGNGGKIRATYLK